MWPRCVFWHSLLGMVLLVNRNVRKIVLKKYVTGTQGSVQKDALKDTLDTYVTKVNITSMLPDDVD